MTGKTRPPAYFAVARGIAEHPFFNYGQPAFSRREAWEWMIEEAAFRPRGHRHVRGIYPLQRGELCATQREMAAAWRWPKSNVEYFLKLLVARGWIQAENRAESKGKRRRITICDYDKYQYRPKSLDQTFRQTGNHESPQLPGIIEETAPQPFNHPESILKNERGGEDRLPSVNYGDKSGTFVNETRPKHGLRARKRGVEIQFFWYGTEQWQDAAEFAEAHRNVKTFPTRYIDGYGNWFRCRTFNEARHWAIKKANG